MTPDSGFPPPTNGEGAPLRGGGFVSAQDAVRAPAIMLIVMNSLSILFCGGLLLFNGFMRLVGDETIRANPEPESRKAVEFMSGPLWATFFAAGLVMALVGLTGSIQMLRLRSYGLAATAAVFGITNIGSFCCFGLSLGAGIWALVVLMRDDVREAFNRP